VAEPSAAAPDALQRALTEFVSFLESRGIAYMIVGAMAVAVWGRPRATADIDVTLRLDREALGALAEHAESAGFPLDRQWLEWNPSLRGQQIRLTRGGLTVDAMRPRDAHEEAALARRRPVPVAGRTLWLVAPDDLILMKLKAGRPRDFEDALTVLMAQRGSLDEGYLSDWAARLGVSGELAYLLDAAGPA
jgi:hypothetical protein